VTKYNSLVSSRSVDLKEQIDLLTLSYEEDVKVFSQLNWLNKLSLNDYLMKKGFKSIAIRIKKQSNQNVKIIDLGCGDGKYLYDISSFLKKKGIQSTCLGFDFNDHLIRKATENYYSEDFRFIAADILSPDFELPECDVLFSSQFIYRFSDSKFLTFMENNVSKIRLALLFTELERSSINQKAFKLLGKVLGLHPVLVEDGCTAIERAWKSKEMHRLLEQMNFSHLNVNTMFHRFSILAFC